MTTRTLVDYFPGVQTNDASDVDGWAVYRAADPVEAAHTYPIRGELVAAKSGIRLHLLNYPDTSEGNPYIEAVPYQPPGDPIPPDFEDAMTLSFSRTSGQVTSVEVNRTGATFIAFDLDIPTDPSGLVYEQGSGANGAYVGFVDGDLVIRNATGADLRIDADAAGITGKTGTLYIEFTAGSRVEAWWLETGDIQVVSLGSDTSAAGQWADTGLGGIGAVEGTANIEGGSAVAPTVRDVAQTFLTGSAKNVTLPAGTVVGNTLLAIATMHTNSQAGAAGASMAGWTPILEYSGANGNYGPAVFVFERRAEATNPATLQATGPTAAWQKTVTVIELENASDVAAYHGESVNGGVTEIDFPAAPGAALTLHMLTSNHADQLPAIPGDTDLISNEPAVRMQQWSIGASNAAVDDVSGLDTGHSHTSITVGVTGGTVGEGTSAFNGTINDGRFYESQTAPDAILDPGSFGTPEIEAQPAKDPANYTPGSVGSVYPEAAAGQFLETIRARIAQSRSGAGYWTARLFALSPDGELKYAPPVAPPEDVENNSETQERYLQAQAAVGDGTLWNDLVDAGWNIGILLETGTSDATLDFGQARLDIGGFRAQWATPPTPTIAYPASGFQITTGTPQVGWTIPTTETQTGYQVRVWSADTYDSATPDAGDIVFDTGRINSASIRSHQVTHPFDPDVAYVIGVRLFGEQVNARTLTSQWQTVTVTAPSSPIVNDALIGPRAVAQTDGSVKVTAANFDTVKVGDWAQIERAYSDEIAEAIARAIDDESDDSSFAAVEVHGSRAEVFTGQLSAGHPTVAVGDELAVEVVYRLNGYGTYDQNATTKASHHYLFALANSSSSGGARVNVAEDPASGDLISFVIYGDGTTSSAVTFRDSQFQTINRNTIEPGVWRRHRVVWSKATGIATLYEVADDGTATVVGTRTNAWPTISSAAFAGTEQAAIGGQVSSAGPTQNQWVGVNGQIRSVLVASGATTLLDFDADRDASSSATEITSRVGPDTMTRGVGSTVDHDGTEVVSVGAVDPSYTYWGVAGNAAGTSGLYVGSDDITAAMLNMGADDDAEYFAEWRGILVKTGSGNEQQTLMQLGEPQDMFRISTTADGRLVVAVQDTASVGSSWIANLAVSPPFGKPVIIRAFFSALHTDLQMQWSDDDGRSWTAPNGHAGTMAVPAANGSASTMRSLDSDGSFIYLSRPTPGQEVLRENAHITFAARFIDLRERRTLFDVDLGRDIPDPASAASGDTFLDKESVTWTLGEAAHLTRHRAASALPADQKSELWSPLHTVRDVTVLPQTATGEDRISFVDPTVPFHRPVEYRVRAVTEQAPFDTHATRWERTPPIVVSSNTWRISRLDGSNSVAVQPSDASWSNDKPGAVAAGIGAAGHVTTADVRKAAFLNMTVETLSKEEHDALLALWADGDPLIVRDVHGRVWIMRAIDTIDTTPRRALPAPGETFPTRHFYELSTTLVEIEDPRGFGYGSIR